MILTYRDVSTLQGANWHIVELRNPRMIEPTLRRLGKALPSIFRDDPVEIFVPVVKRDLDVFELSTEVYAFARSTSFSALFRLKSVTGVAGLVTAGDSGRASQVLTWPDEDVQKLIATAEEEFRQRAVGIEAGSFVRILNGEMRDLCGVVEIICDGKAVVRITLRTKSILLETPIRNLLNLGQVSKEQRVYYYGPLVDQLIKDFPEEGPKLMEEDLHFDEPKAQIEVLDEPLSEHEPKKHSRQRTVWLTILNGSRQCAPVVRRLKAKSRGRKPPNSDRVRALLGAPLTIATMLQRPLPFDRSPLLLDD